MSRAEAGRIAEVRAATVKAAADRVAADRAAADKVAADRAALKIAFEKGFGSTKRRSSLMNFKPDSRGKPLGQLL